MREVFFPVSKEAGGRGLGRGDLKHESTRHLCSSAAVNHESMLKVISLVEITFLVELLGMDMVSSNPIFMVLLP